MFLHLKNRENKNATHLGMTQQSPKPALSPLLGSIAFPAHGSRLGQLFAQRWDLAAVTELTQRKISSELMYLQQRYVLMTPGLCSHPFISAKSSRTGKRLR